jgi:putative ABC transport system permease protein
MKLRNIATNNLRRRKSKMLFLVAGLMVGVAAMTALLATTRVLKQEIASKMDAFGANILITPRTQGLSLSYGGLNLGGVAFDLKRIAQEDVARIREIKNASNIRLISPKVFGIFSRNDQKALVVGVDFPVELKLKSWWQVIGRPPGRKGEVLAGSRVAEKFDLSPGSMVDIRGRSFTVAGMIQETGSQDDELIFMSLPEAQGLFQKEGTVGMIEVAALCKNCPISEIVAQIRRHLPDAKVTAIQQVVKGRMETLKSFQGFSLAISALVLLVGALVVLVTMMGSVTERTREIGIFSAIGFRRSHIMRIILLEALIISWIAGIAGYIGGLAASRGLVAVLAENAAFSVLNPDIAAVSLVLAVATGLLASLYPAAMASRMDPSEALRAL